MHWGTSPSFRSHRTAAVHFQFLGCFEPKSRSCPKCACCGYFFRNAQPNAVESQLAHINTQALQTIKDQQLQILTAIIPLLPSLQKVPLHIASTEANLKEAIRKSAAAAAPITGTQFTNIGSISGSRKRRSPKNPYHCTPSPSVTKRKRIRVDTSCTTQQQLPSPKSSRDSLLIQGGLPTTNHHRSIGDALRSSSRPPSGSIDTAQTPNPGRLSMQPPTPMILSTTPSRRQSIFLPEMPVQPTSSLSHKRESTSGVSVTPVFARPAPGTKSDTPVPFHHLNHSRDAFKVSTRLHTPLHSDSKRLNDQQTRPSAQPPSSVGFSAVRCQLTHEPLSAPRLPNSIPFPPFVQRRGKRFIPITDDDEDDEIFDD